MGSVALTLPLPSLKPGGTAPPVALVFFADAGARDWSTRERPTQRPAHGACVGYGIRVGPIRFDVRARPCATPNWLSGKAGLVWRHKPPPLQHTLPPRLLGATRRRLRECLEAALISRPTPPPLQPSPLTLAMPARRRPRRPPHRVAGASARYFPLRPCCTRTVSNTSPTPAPSEVGAPFPCMAAVLLAR